jgi:alpha-maltose-1-phosphate synthase
MRVFHYKRYSSMSTVPFSIYYAGDAYSTANKIMGRQSAGKAFMRGVARTWPDSILHGVGLGSRPAESMFKQLQLDGFKGSLRWNEIPDWNGLSDPGCMYYPSPSSKDFASSRNAVNPAAFSLMGVTFTLSSNGAMDQVADLILPPFKPWDAMICISQAALDFTTQLHDEMKSWWSSQTGATRFNLPQLPVIPLGVDCQAFAPKLGQKESARSALKIADNEVVFLFAGRLSFHAKGNPAPMYQALEVVAKSSSVVCIEAGVFPNDAIRAGFIAAQQKLAPSVKFIWVDGNDELRYQQAWQCADAFISLSDNIQETFGLTPVEAMAAGLPVVVSDWNGYKDTIRDGIDGFRIPTILPPSGTGTDLAVRHALGIDSYDYFIGRASLATVIAPDLLANALTKLATQPELRKAMSAAGLEHAQTEFDWPVILRRYALCAENLNAIRLASGPQVAESWPNRADPFTRFSHFSTHTLKGNWIVNSMPDAGVRLRELLDLQMASYALHAQLLPKESIVIILDWLELHPDVSVNTLLDSVKMTTSAGVRMLMWLWKFNLIRVQA